MEINDIVLLNTFLGTKSPTEKIATNENYWKLIGQTGKILNKKEDRMLVLFECEIDLFELENHNPLKNSLWILTSDLKRIKN